jgi:SpoVK/Ycf46/Vps4 family AAA+-type ATPase
MISRACILLLTIISISAFSFPAAAHPLQAREHLTPQEVELVKDTQVLDKRIDVFVKAVDRRMLAINRALAAEATNAKQLKKDSEIWGDLPSGTRAELIGDIARIFEEAITNIDDVSARDEKNPLLPKALRKLAAAASRIVDQLKPLQAQAQSDEEIGSFDQLIENAESILQAANRLPPPVEKKAKNKTEKTTEVH